MAKKLIIKGFEKQDGASAGKIELQINPDSFSHNFTNTNTPTATDGGISTIKYTGTTPEKVSFTTRFDGTGIIKGSVPVSDSIKDLTNLVYKFNGSSHQPNYLEIEWGTFFFGCKLDTMSVKYTMFTSGGEPLRAEVTMNFTQSVTEDMAKKAMDKQSPDLTHIKTVRLGDRLPIMCKEIYGDTSFHLQIATINNLVNPRNLDVGQQLIFPPLKK